MASTSAEGEGNSSALPKVSASSIQERSEHGSPAPPKGVLKKNASIKSISLSKRERIDSILDGARERKVAMEFDSEREGRGRIAGASGTASENVSPGARLDSREGRNIRENRETESSADEETAIMRRGSGRGTNYQGANQQRGTAGNKDSVQTARRSPERERSEEDVADEHQGWWAKLLSEYGSIELENKGSVARDHLALERTFLAWLRTSLAFASIGIAITQLFRLNTTSSNTNGDDRYRHLRQMGKPLGATFLGISIVMLFIGFHRYFESQHWIIRGKFPASRGSVMLVAMMTFALMITSLVVVIVVEPRSFES